MNPKYNALFTSVNILLGVGPLILPYSFFQGGILLSSLWMLFIVIISYNSASYIVEAMAKVRHIDIKQKSELQDSLLTQQNEQQNTLASVVSETLPLKTEQSENRLSTSDFNRQYDHIEQFQILYGPQYRVFPSLAISIYLTGTAISKCIMTGNILSEVFEEVYILNRFEIWLGLFFLSGAAFSFKSIDSTKSLQFVIIIVRVISIGAMIFGAIFLIVKNGPKQATPKDGGIFNLKNFAEIFSNSLFSFLFHHSLPGIANPIKNTTDRSYFIKMSFVISGIILFLISLTACFAFGQQLGVHTYKYYNFDFKSNSDTEFIYYIVSFYVFLNIAAFSVYIIVIRTNILKVTSPGIDAMKLSRKTIMATAILLIIIFIIAFLLQQYIQYVLDFTGGILGSVILFYIPSLQVYRARKRVWKLGDVKNYIEKLPFVIMFIGSILMFFNLYEVVTELIKE